MRVAQSHLALFLFGIIWTSFTVNFIHEWHQGAGPPTSSFWGFNGIASELFFIPFLLIGVGMLLSPLWAYFHARRMVYAITNNRILIVQQGKTRRIESYGRSELGNIARVERPDKSGDLMFAQKHYKDSDGDQQTKDIKFVGIPQVQQVETLLRETFAVGA